MSKTNFILAALAVAQAAILFFFMGESSAAEFEDEMVAQGTRPLSQLFEEDLGSIVIRESGEDSVELARKENGWVLSNRDDYPAKPEATKDLAKALRKLYLVRPISVAPKRFYDLGISDDRFSRHVKVKSKDGKTLADFYLGEAGSMDRLFYREAGGEKVFTASGLATWDLESSVANWIEAAKLDIDIAQVRSITRSGSDAPAIDLKGTEAEGPESKVQWTAADGTILDQKKVNAWLTSLSGITIKEPLGKDPASAPGITEPGITLTISFKDSETKALVLNLGEERPETYDWVFKASNQAYYGTIRDFVRDDLLAKALKDLKPDAPKEESPPK